MNRSKFTAKRMLGGLAAVALALGLGWATGASGGPPPKLPGAQEVRPHSELPDAAVREITTPDNNLTVSGMFHNCKVIKVVSPKRVYEVTKGDGAIGNRIIQGGFFTQRPDGGLDPLPPFNPACNNVGPTPAQEAEMARIAGVVLGPDGKPAPLPPRPQP